MFTVTAVAGCRVQEIEKLHHSISGHAVAQWLRHCATNWKVAGSIPDGVIENFH
jgi:hypothetical protein